METWRLRRFLHDLKVYLLWLYSTVIGKVSFIVLTALIITVIVSTILFSHLEGIDIFKSLYWSVITITTVGYGDIVPHNFFSRILAMSVALVGYAGLTAALSLVANSLINRSIREREGDISVKGTRILVIGSSNMCLHIAQLLKSEVGSRGRIVWLTTYDPNITKIAMEAMDRGIVVVRGNLTSIESYLRAGIETSHDVIVCGKDDKESVAIALMLRTLEQYLTYLPRVIVVAHSDRSEKILLQEIGVDMVVPSKALGTLLMDALREPSAAIFLTALSESHPKLIEIDLLRLFSNFDFAKVGNKLCYIGTKGVYQVSEIIDVINARSNKYIYIIAKVYDLDQIQPIMISDFVAVGDKLLAVEFEDYAED